MTLLEYIDDSDRRRALARAVSSSGDYLWQIATGRRKAGHALAKAIENATIGAVTRQELRPDIFGPPPVDQASAAPDLVAVPPVRPADSQPLNQLQGAA